jgi:hypothetical protein
MTDLNNSLQNQISLKSDQWERIWYMRSDGQKPPRTRLKLRLIILKQTANWKIYSFCKIKLNQDTTCKYHENQCNELPPDYCHSVCRSVLLRRGMETWWALTPAQLCSRYFDENQFITVQFSAKVCWLHRYFYEEKFISQLHAPVSLHPGQRTLHSAHRIRSWMGPRAGLEGLEKRKIPCHQELN